ncbi:zinc ribbon-containing protein [Culicoidibacter larvae]|nr:hypothetical protein [Culicoidibacter larvae]
MKKYELNVYTCINCGKKMHVTEVTDHLPPCSNCGADEYTTCSGFKPKKENKK